MLMILCSGEYVVAARLELLKNKTVMVIIFVSVKRGSCPEFPRGPWVCTDMCTGDSDCPKTLKCCQNRCGALTCQRPRLD